MANLAAMLRNGKTGNGWPVSKSRPANMHNGTGVAVAMPIADMIRLGTVRRMTAQEIADMALSEDRAHRAALARGDTATALAHEAEMISLCALLDERKEA